MSLQIFMREKMSIKILLLCLLVTEFSFAGWEIDLSRRRRQIQKVEEATGVKPVSTDADANLIDKATTPANNSDVVILNTEKGFLPRAVQLRKGETYTLHIVNVNEKEKNTSFIMDSFKEHHSTYYGQIKSFTIKPDKEGIYTFQCPETSIEGRAVIYKDDGKAPMRAVASEKSDDGE